MHSNPTRRERAQRTRDAILEAAHRLFVHRGYEPTTIRQVAEAAGVSVGSVHVHFGDKHGLLLACLYDGLQRTIDGLWSTLPQQAPLEDQLLHCARHLFRGYAEHPDLSQAMLSGSLFPRRPQEDPFILPFLSRIAGLVEAAGRRGELAIRDDQAMAMSQVFFALYFSTLLGGLGGAFGDAPDADARAALWTEHLAPLLEVVLHPAGGSDGHAT